MPFPDLADSYLADGGKRGDTIPPPRGDLVDQRRMVASASGRGASRYHHGPRVDIDCPDLAPRLWR